MKLFFLVLNLSICYFSIAQKLYINQPDKYNLNIVPHKEIVLKSLDSLLLNRLNREYVFNKFTKADQKLWGYSELTNTFYIAGINYPEMEYFKPTVLGIIDVVPAQKYLVKIAFTSRDDSIHNSINLIYSVMANYDSLKNKVEYEKYTNWYIKNWYAIQLSNILFYKQSKNNFSLKEANKFCKFNNSMAQFFKLKPKKFVYFSCKDPIQLYNLKGYDFLPNMFWSRNGGFISYGGDSTYVNIIYSANNKEYYAHELVHFYVNEFTDSTTSTIANEGIATFLGGSAEFPLSHHLKELKKYINKNHLSPTNFFNEYDMKMIDSDVSTLYSTGGLLAKLIYEKKGLDGLKRFLKIPENKLKAELPKLLELKNISLDDYLKQELVNY